MNDEITIKESEVVDEFPDEKLLMIQERPWFFDLANHKATSWIPEDLNFHERKKIPSRLKFIHLG